MKQLPRVVVAENDTDNISPLTEALRVHKRWKLYTANNEKDVIALAVSKGADAVVLDGLFPGSVLYVLDRLQSSARTAHIPVLGVTGNMGPQSNEMLAGGALKCVARPIGDRELTAALREMLKEATPIMQAPQSAISDPERISVLEETGVMDFSPSEEFDEISKLTAKILRVPVALVSLVDEDRQFFLSQHGLVEPWATMRETPLSHSFCQWVVAGKEPLVVQDAREHAVLANNLAVKNIGVIAYAGQPITAGNKQVIGSMCAIDGHPRSWTLDELATLRDIAQLTESYIVFGKKLLDSNSNKASDFNLSDANRSSAIQSAAKGIEAITRVLLRKGVPMSLADRKKLIAMIQNLNNKQLALLAV